MKRRSFIRNTAVSAISLGMFAPDIIASPLSFQGTSVAQWFRQLSWAFSGRRRSIARVAPEALTQLISTTNGVFAKRGYQVENEALYFLGKHEDWCIYPLILPHTAFDTPPFVMPVFHRQGDHWHLVITLDGFEVEAISKASHALAELDPTALQNLLIPTGKAGAYPGGTAYKTRGGIVAIKTVQRGGKAQTTCIITGREGKIFSETFISRHCIMA